MPRKSAAPLLDRQGQTPDIPNLSGIHIDLARGTVNPSDLIAQIQAGSNWHNNIVSLVGYYVSQGWSAAQVHDVCGQGDNE